ncbi:P-loop containing nucleoside triphosphate hydrolase protein [Gigaspora margarita]|uniref:P-loop containing nucleoside triphosphate hydrolase protein n=1 Tax=Gigaspora margarita TaxID=4874 RepID=A0A8H3WU19_GIGMA|nr:P-loop containing nucleoside triphosphate hydrolase protein [Gigaspora margarita]
MTQLETIKNTPYAKKASSYINIINELRRIGADFSVDLPRIVFCGNQSAGKSSLIEAISGVKLPRSDGTCTRCVMEIRLSESIKEWSCQVRLRKEYDENEKRLNKPIETEFGSLIVDPNDVELMARRAQKALLNPKQDSDKYFNWDFGSHNYEEDAQRNAVKFTKNVVCIEIKGPDVPNLSLIDLPGIIRYTEKLEDEKFIALIEELVKEYIHKEKSIIVATISCKDDIDNQAIVSLAKNADISGIRTLGVLTKPDTIEEGTHDKWLKIMRNEAHRLDLGYYAVKNPSQKHLNDGITFEDARQDEINFFEQGSWKKFLLRERIGVVKLRLKLSDLLIQSIIRGLPSVRKEIEIKLSETRQELEKIPEQLSDNPRIEIYRMAKKCSTIIKSKTMCSNNQVDLWQSINKEFEFFIKELYNSRPIFTVGINETEVDILDEFIKTKVIERHYNKNPMLDTTNTTDKLSHIKFTKFNNKNLQKISETQVKEKIKTSRGRLLPGFIPSSVAETLIKETNLNWKTPAISCLNAIHLIVLKLVNESIDMTFSRFPNLIGQIRYIANSWLEECKNLTAKYIDFLYQMQSSDPFTLDERSIISQKSTYLNAFHDILKKENQDPTSTLEIMALTMAYFKISLNRYVDIIAMTIIHAFVDEFTKYIEEKMIEICIPDGKCSLDELIKEDDSIKHHRDYLVNREKDLKEIFDSLVRFGI